MPEVVSYNPDTGSLSGLSVHNTVDGYLQTGRYKGKQWRVHRLAFFLMEGREPTSIDHINGDKQDNRWCNLREVGQLENQKNRKRSKNNTSGVTGVSWAKNVKKWHAYIKVNYTRHTLGHFDTLFDAVAARKSAERYYGFHANHDRG